jgi:hypothetical protein
LVEVASFCRPLVGTRIVFLQKQKEITKFCLLTLTSIKNENVINDSLLAIALSAAENYQVLPELRG